MQAAMKSGFFDAADGLKLYSDWYYPESGVFRAGVLIVHGYADHGGRYAELARALVDRGYAAMTFDYRGHGQAGGPRGHCDYFDDYLSDFQRACARARLGIGNRPLAVFAHSHGGLIALRALAQPGRMPADVSGVALSSPFLGIALKLSAMKVAVGKLASRLVPKLALTNEIPPEWLSHDPKIIAARKLDRFCHSVATARWFDEATLAQDYVLSHASSIDLPTLWMLAGDDKIADSTVARQGYDLAGGQKQLQVYDGFFHEVFNETERARVYGDLDTWLSRAILAN
jgi:alpha-beta hydrolase superfamily lysophospholipase